MVDNMCDCTACTHCFIYPPRIGHYVAIQTYDMKPIMTTITVTMPAPTLSPVVISGSVSKCWPKLDPASGSPLLVPPVEFVNVPVFGFGNKLMRAESTLICWQAPTSPSNDPDAHRKPHIRPLLPPVHWLTAACAELRRIGFIVSARYGARKAVDWSQRCINPLNDSISVVQVPPSSQARSTAVPFGKKNSSVRGMRKSSLLFHFSAPSVCISSVQDASAGRPRR